MEMLAVDEEEFNNIKELINEHICDGCEESYSGEYSRGVPCNNGEICLQNLFNGKAKADADVEIARIKRDVVEDIFNDVLGLIVDTDWYGEMIDCNDVRNLKQKYIGEK